MHTTAEVRDPKFLLRTIPGGSSPLSSDDATLRQTFERLHAGAAQNIELRNQFSRSMDSLQNESEALDRLLIDRVQGAVREGDPVAYRRLQVVLGMQIQLNTITKRLGNFLLTGEVRYAERMDDAQQKLHEFARAYQVLLLKPEERLWAGELQRRLNRVLSLTTRLRGLEKERRERLAAFLALYRDLKVQLDIGVKTGTERGLEKAREELLSAGQTANTTILLALLFSVVFGVAAGIMTTQQDHTSAAAPHRGHARYRGR